MAQCSITITVKVAWWVRPYLRLMTLAARLGFQPDREKVEQRAKRGLKVVGTNPPSGLLQRLRQWWCSHEFSITAMRRVSPKRVDCPCAKCGKQFHAAAGLYLPGKLVA